MNPRPCTWPDGGCGHQAELDAARKVVDVATRYLLAVRNQRTAPGKVAIGRELADALIAYDDACWHGLPDKAAELERERAAGQATKAGRP